MIEKSIAIVYSTFFGFSEEVAKFINAKLDYKAELINLSSNHKHDISKFDIVVIGCSITVGNSKKDVKEFCCQNIDLLKTKKIALFMSCMYEGETAERQFNMVFPETLRMQSLCNAFSGFALQFEKLNFLQRFMVKKIAKVKESVWKMNEDAMINLVKCIKKDEVL